MPRLEKAAQPKTATEEKKRYAVVSRVHDALEQGTAVREHVEDLELAAQELGVGPWQLPTGGLPLPLQPREPRRLEIEAQHHAAELVENARTASVGPIAFEGLRRVSEAFARSQIPWREGEPYRESRLARAGGDPGSG